MSTEQENLFFCKECGWHFPHELVDNLIKNGETIYCEKCGAENRKDDFDSSIIEDVIEQEKKKNLWNVLTSAKNKSSQYKKKIKSKIKELQGKSGKSEK